MEIKICQDDRNPRVTMKLKLVSLTVENPNEKVYKSVKSTSRLNQYISMLLLTTYRKYFPQCRPGPK